MALSRSGNFEGSSVSLQDIDTEEGLYTNNVAYRSVLQNNEKLRHMMTLPFYTPFNAPNAVSSPLPESYIYFSCIREIAGEWNSLLEIYNATYMVPSLQPE